MMHHRSQYHDHPRSGMTLLSHERQLLKGFRIPVIASRTPRNGWLVAIDEESYPVLEFEAAQIESYTEYIVKRLYSHFRERLLRDDFPMVAGHDTLVLRKGHRMSQRNNIWFHRKLSWRDGAYLPSGRIELAPTRTLTECLDIVSEINPAPWRVWRYENAHVFQLH